MSTVTTCDGCGNNSLRALIENCSLKQYVSVESGELTHCRADLCHSCMDHIKKIMFSGIIKHPTAQTTEKQV